MATILSARKYFLLLSLCFSVLYAVPSLAEEKTPSPNWDVLLDVGYRFSLLPEEDLTALLNGEGEKYGQPLSEYAGLWTSRLSGEAKEGTASKGTAHPSYVYRRVAVAHLLLYLSTGKEESIDEALNAIEPLSVRRVTPRIIFWHNLIQAHKSLLTKDSLAFSHHVFRLWNDVVLVLEKGQMMFGTRVGTTGFNHSLPYLYENVVHLVLHHGIVKHKLPKLYALGTVIWSLKDRLEKDKGYYQLAESIWNRMRGLQSDNFNINFAMAYLEGEMHFINYEGAKIPAEAGDSLERALNFFELSLTWADTRKGRAAILSRLVRSMVRILNESLQAEGSTYVFTRDIPRDSLKYSASAKDLYRELSGREIMNEGWWEFEGFDSKENYIKAMHDLWFNISQLDVMISRYYAKNSTAGTGGQGKTAHFERAAASLVDYLDFFEEFTRKGSLEIVPHNAYFYAAYFAGELADIHRQSATYSNDMNEFNLAFARQLQAIEIFPFEIIGLLKLSMQVSQDGTLNTYIDNVWPLADRLPISKTVSAWSEDERLPYYSEILTLKRLIPETLKSAPSIIGLQSSESSNRQIVSNTLLLTHLLGVLLQSDLAEKSDKILEKIADGLDEGGKLDAVSQKNLPPELYTQLEEAKTLIDKCNFSAFKKELFRDPEHGHHKLFRNLYYEAAADKMRYLHLLDNLKEKRLASPGGKTGDYRQKSKDVGKRDL